MIVESGLGHDTKVQNIVKPQIDQESEGKTRRELRLNRMHGIELLCDKFIGVLELVSGRMQADHESVGDLARIKCRIVPLSPLEMLPVSRNRQQHEQCRYLEPQ